MHLKFWGVRGSYPVPKRSTCRVGGNTACVQICPEDGTTLIVDAGTGIRRLGQELVASGNERPCHLLISHTHWDHIQGLPFFAPLYLPSSQINIHARQRDVNLKTLFSSQASDPYFPVGLDEVAAQVSYQELTEGERFAVGSAEVSCARLNHPYVSIGYRVEADGCAVAYVSDTGPFERMVLGYEYIAEKPDPQAGVSASDAQLLADMRQGVVDLCRDADAVVYDTMFEHNEYRQYPHWGHSTPEQALEVIRDAGAKCLVLFHHHPVRNDDEQLAIGQRVGEQTDIEVVTAIEGEVLQCGAGGARVVSQ